MGGALAAGSCPSQHTEPPRGAARHQKLEPDARPGGTHRGEARGKHLGMAPSCSHPPAGAERGVYKLLPPSCSSRTVCLQSREMRGEEAAAGWVPAGRTAPPQPQQQVQSLSPSVPPGQHSTLPFAALCCPFSEAAGSGQPLCKVCVQLAGPALLLLPPPAQHRAPPASPKRVATCTKSSCSQPTSPRHQSRAVSPQPGDTLLQKLK